MTKIFDGDFLPEGGFRPVERPLPRTHLQEMLEGQQVARLHYLDQAGPTGSRGLAFELTDGSKLVVWAGRDRYSKFSARLFFRRVPPPLILTPERAAGFSRGRAADPDAGPPDDLQREVEGEVVRYVIHHKEPTERAGECIEFELKAGARLYLAAVPMERVRRGEKLLADVEWVFTKPERRHVVMP